MMDREQMATFNLDGKQIAALAAENADRKPTAIIERCSTGTFIDALRRIAEADSKG
jgi:hypothetical protein